jgi:RHS repeat-associated protein
MPSSPFFRTNHTQLCAETGEQVNGLGRLIEVDEPNSPTATVNSNGCPGTSDPIWVTTYGYDQLGNLLSVVQVSSRPRSFTYDSLSRLLTATNPESGQLTYTYDADGNVTTKITPLQNQSSGTATLSYCYDTLNRMTSKAYTNQSCPQTSPVATYTYDGSACLGQASCYNIGHRTGMTDPAGSESWAYDTMGRTAVQSRTTNSITKTTKYTYNLDSSVATLTYPSGRVMTYTPDTAGRPSNVEDNTSSVYYATGTCANDVSGNGVCYAPQGEVALLQNSSEIVSTHIYNNRLQPCWTYSTTGTALAWGNTTNCATNESTAGNMFDQKYNFNLGSDNGTLVSMTNNRVTDRSQTFSYDQLNRVATAQTTATYASDSAHCWGQIFGFDSTGDWSNLLSIGGVSSAYTGCSQNSLSVIVNANNQITGDTYDAAGNLWIIPGMGGATYLYNAENQMTSTSNSSMNYIYDGDGNRVEKSGTKIYWYGGSKVLDETDTTGSVTNGSFNEYVFFGGNRVARRDSSGDVFYYLVDQIGSSRVIAEVPSGQTTATMCYDGDFEPYGGEHAYLNTCSQNYKFTGKERDSESDLDNFGARYYASTTGRFMSPDWALKAVSVPYASFGDPQTLNLYTYVENSPLNRIDADGHCPECRNGANDGSVESEAGPSTSCTPNQGGACQTQANATAQANQANAAQNTTQTETQPQTQTQPKQLSADDVSNGIQSAKADTGSNAKKTVDFLNSFGTNWNLSGDALRQGLKDSKVDAHGVDNKVDSVSRTGDKVTVQLNKGINYLIYKTKTTITFDVGKVDGRPALVNIQGVEHLTYHYVPKTQYGPD